MSNADDPNKTPEMQELTEQCKEIGHVLHEAMPPGVGFALLMFDFVGSNGEKGNLTYISDATRETMICALDELRARMLGGGSA